MRKTIETDSSTMQKILARNNSSSISPKNSVEAFVTAISDSREALDIFTHQVKKRGYIKNEQPLARRHQEYVHRFIDPINRPTILSLTRSTEEIDPQRVLRDSLPSIKKSNFIPIKDILTKGYDERVKEYLDQMKDQTLEDVFKAELPREEKKKHTRKLKTLPT